MRILRGSVFPVPVPTGGSSGSGDAMPARCAFDGARAALFEGTGEAEDAVAVGEIRLVSAPIALLTYGFALGRAKRTGSLSDY